MTPAAFWPSIHDSAFSLRASTDKPKEERNRHSSWCQSGGLLYFVLLCSAFLTLHNDCFWFLVVVVFFFSQNCFIFFYLIPRCGQLQSTRKRNSCEQQHWEERVLNPLHLRSFEVQRFVRGPFSHMDRDSEPTTKQTEREKGVASQREDVHCATESFGPENEV